MTPRILFIAASAERSPQQRQLAALAGGLAEQGFDVHTCTLDGKASGDCAANHAASINRMWPYDLAAWWQLRRHIARLKPALVHTWSYPARAFGGSAALSAAVKHLVSDDREEPTGKPAVEGAFSRFLHRRSAAVVVETS